MRRNVVAGAWRGAQVLTHHHHAPSPSLSSPASWLGARVAFGRAYSTALKTGTLASLTHEFHNVHMYDKSPFRPLNQAPFPPEVAKILTAPINPKSVEIKPDGNPYLPEIKYRRILFKAFGPGGWALQPLTPPMWENDFVSREYALFCNGVFVSQAVGEHQVFDRSQAGAANEATKSNALMRCCKDLGIASELWDPEFIARFKQEHCVGVWCEHQRLKEKRLLWRRQGRPQFGYPWKEVS